MGGWGEKRAGEAEEAEEAGEAIFSSSAPSATSAPSAFINCSLLTDNCSLFPMRRDSIFYKLFQQYPALLFELLTNPPENASEYTFNCQALKETKFEIDGVFLPPENNSPGVVYFVEVQFQKDEKLYERLFAESYLYFYRNRDDFSDLQMVIIYPSRQ